MPVLEKNATCPKCGKRGDLLFTLKKYVSPVDSTVRRYEYREYLHRTANGSIKTCHIYGSGRMV